MTIWPSVTSHENGTLNYTADKTYKFEHYNTGVLVSGKSGAVVFWEICVVLDFIEYCLLLAVFHLLGNSQ
jgi:hypothetical protein